MGKRIYYNQLTKEDINNNLRNNQIEKYKPTAIPLTLDGG